MPHNSSLKENIALHLEEICATYLGFFLSDWCRSIRERINSPELPRINGDLKALLVRFLQQARRDVSKDAAAADVAVQEAALHFVAALPHGVPINAIMLHRVSLYTFYTIYIT